MHTTAVLFSDLCMASTASFRNSSAKLGGLGALDFVRNSVTGSAIRCSAVAFAGCLAMYTAGIFLNYAAMACRAGGLRNRRMRIFFMFHVAALACDCRVHMVLELITHFAVAG